MRLRLDAELAASIRAREDETAYQVAREYRAVLGSDRNEAQARRLQHMIPLDRERVLDLGCGAGYWSAAIARLLPWVSVVGVDVGTDFIAAARDTYASERVSFELADFASLPFADETFDCVYADNSLEHAYDVEAALAEAHRVLADGGVLVAAIPSDARRPEYDCDNHTWKTIPSDVRARLQHAGFTNISIDEVDVFRRLGAAPFAPSDDRSMYVRSWKRAREASELERAREAMAWLYARLDPEHAAANDNAIDVIAGGTAFCAGYAAALGTLLEREGFEVRWLAMEATGHPSGRGADLTDTHVAVQAKVDGRWMVLDAMANTVIPHALGELLRNPSLAVDKEQPDERYRARGYRLYDTAFWYSRVERYRVHRALGSHLRVPRRNRRRLPVGSAP